MLSKSMSFTKNCNDLAVGVGQQNGPSSFPRQCPTARCTTSASEVEWIGLWSFASSAMFTWPLANWLPLQASQQFFAGKMLPQPARCRKGFPRVRQILKHRFSCYRNKLISHWQKCVDCTVSILIDKDLFEPSFNEL